MPAFFGTGWWRPLSSLPQHLTKQRSYWIVCCCHSGTNSERCLAQYGNITIWYIALSGSTVYNILSVFSTGHTAIMVLCCHVTFPLNIWAHIHKTYFAKSLCKRMFQPITMWDISLAKPADQWENALTKEKCKFGPCSSRLLQLSSGALARLASLAQLLVCVCIDVTWRQYCVIRLWFRFSTFSLT